MRARVFLFWCLAALPGVSHPVLAQQALPPACNDVESRQFDFWSGKWDVFSAEKLVGHNDITREEGDCILHEHWSGLKGGTGQSVSYYDPGEKQWYQTWTDGSATFRRFHGKYQNSAMRLTAESKTAAGQPRQHRMAFINNADGTVRQLAETSEDGKQWRTVVDLMYRRPATSPQVSAPTGGCSAAEYRQFDFWVGSWDVTVAGNPAGSNVITLEEQGCLIHEHWTGAKGGTGQSLNFYDKSTRLWNQVWVDNSAGSLRLSGTFAGDQMGMTGVAPGPDGKPQQQRLTFFKNPDGTVRQLWETSSDGATWQVSFDGLYRRKG
jgi:hypothetical protein